MTHEILSIELAALRTARELEAAGNVTMGRHFRLFANEVRFMGEFPPTLEHLTQYLKIERTL